MFNSVKILMLLTILWCLASGNQQHLVCKTVEDIFAEGGQSESTQRRRQLQGPRGERGIPGIKGRRGLPGPRGAPAIVDYERINETIDEKIARALAEFKLQIDSMLKNMPLNTFATTGSATGAISPTTATSCSDEGLIYNGKCYTLRGHSSTYHMNHNAAKNECAKHGALMAEIHDRAQQVALFNYIRPRNLQGDIMVQAWIGMQYQTSTSTLLYRSGKQIEANRFGWYLHYPSNDAVHKYMAVSVPPSDVQNSGIANIWESANLQGVVCERSM